MRAIGLFCDLAYYPSLVAVVNSLLCFEVQAHLRVYDFHGLPHLLRSYLARWAEVVQPPPSALGDHYREHWYYRPRLLAAADGPEQELVIDVDTVVLSDLEEAFGAIAAGQVVVVPEWTYRHPESARDYRPLPAGSVFHRRLAHPEVYRQGMPIYNGGLVGFDRRRHRSLLALWHEATRCHDELAETFFALDQHSLSLLLAAMRRSGELAVHELPPALWMQTWEGHHEPPKRLTFERGRPVLHNGEAGAMRFYHYTGDIVAPPELAGGRRQLPVRFAHLVSDLGLPAGLETTQMEAAWHQVWRQRHATPAGELPRLFYELGPLRAPRCLDPRWRESLARLLVACGGSPVAGARDRDGAAVWALALAHDYVDYLGYRAGELGWLRAPLLALLGEDRLARGERTVGWEGEADVVLALQPCHRDQREWTGGEYAAGARRYAEHRHGIYVSVTE